MNSLCLALFSGIILSLNQVLIKLFLDKYQIFNLSSYYNLKFLSFAFLILFIFLIGVCAWIFALKNSQLTNIYWTTALYYLAVPLFSYLIINESISRPQMIGYFIISIGAVVSSTN